MKTIVNLIAMLVFLSVSTSAQMQDDLSLGSTIPMGDLKMEDVSGETLSLNEVAGENGLLVVFSCNTCPYVKAWEDRYLTISALARKKGIGMIALNPNEKMRDDKESMAAMKEVSESMGYTFPYVVDKNHVLADAFGATKTPHIYLFNADGVLVYSGAIDDNSSSASEVNHTYLADAITQLADGEEITTKTSKALGCSIKRIKK